MDWFRKKQYYLIASVVVLLVTYIVFSGFDAIFATPETAVLQQVYLAPVDKIPVLKSELMDLSQVVATDSAGVTLQQQPEFSIADSLTAKSAYVVDIDTDTVLFDRNSQRILLPASTTKLMTALVAYDAYEGDLSRIIQVPKLPRIEGFRNDFVVGQEFSVQALIQAALIQSNNDAAYILAMQSPYGLETFVRKMNEKAQELQLSSTYYENPAGFDAEGQRSTARDLVVLTKEVMKNDFLKSVVNTPQAIINDISGKSEYYLENTHQLLFSDPTVVGVKTGTTEGASQVLITQFDRNGHNIVIVIMGSGDRYLETNMLIDWVFNSYEWVSIEELL